MSPLVKLLLWSSVGVGIGILVFLLVPLVRSARGDYETRSREANRFWTMAMAILRRGLLIKREHSGYTLLPASYDSDMTGEKMKLDGRTGHAKDHVNAMSRLQNRPFGMVFERKNAIVTPLHAYLGEHYGRVCDEGGDTKHVRLADGETKEAWVNTIDVPESPGLVDMSESSRLLPGFGGLWLGEVAKDFAKKSQSGFMSSRAAEFMIIVTAFAVGFGLPVIAISQLGAGSASGSIDAINLMLVHSGVIR